MRALLLWPAAVLAALLVAFAACVALLSGVSLSTDRVALARIDVRPLAGSVSSVRAFGPSGREIPLAMRDGLLTPLRRVRPGERIALQVTVRRPGWLSWVLGAERTEHLTVTTPVASVVQHWLTVRSGGLVRVAFDMPVSRVSVRGRTSVLPHAARYAGFRPGSATGTAEVAAAARSWETLGAPAQVSWFPPSRETVMASLPAPGARITPASTIYLAFSRPVSQALGGARPRLQPATAGRWSEPNSHTLQFVPAGYGVPLGASLHLQLPRAVAVSSGGTSLSRSTEVGWYVPPGSTLRLQQLLAQAGYLPVDWQPAGAEVARTPAAEVAAAVQPPAGAFRWRYGNTPPQLQGLWTPGVWNEVTRGAVMKFENDHELTVDGEPGPAVWRALIREAIAGRRTGEPYSYVYVHREVPETATLWSAGRTVISSPANTGIEGAETELGTFPVFEHIPEGTMSGTNPDGSHYEDPGIKWISYFNGGDALHNFDRASFGTPQSLGCVELPLEAAAEIWKYTPIGTLVTVEP